MPTAGHTCRAARARAAARSRAAARGADRVQLEHRQSPDGVEQVAGPGTVQQLSPHGDTAGIGPGQLVDLRHDPSPRRGADGRRDPRPTNLRPGAANPTTEPGAPVTRPALD